MTVETFLPAAPVTPAATVTVAGFGTGTTDEIALYISQMRDELDTAQRDLAAAAIALDARPSSLEEILAELIDRRIELALANRSTLHDELDTVEVAVKVEEIVKGMDLFEGIDFDSAVQGVVEAALADATVEVEARILT
jgi:hypothetical protein